MMSSAHQHVATRREVPAGAGGTLGRQAATPVLVERMKGAPGGFTNVRRFLSWGEEPDPVLERIRTFRQKISAREVCTDSVSDLRELRDSE